MLNLVDTFSEFKNVKNIDRPTLVRVLEDVFRTLIKKKFGSDENFNVIVNASTGDLELWRIREVVNDGEVGDEKSQISITGALEIDEDYEIGDECYERLYLEEFGRRAIQAARQTLMTKIMDLQKDEIYKRYVDRIGEIVTCEVHQILRKDILVFDDATGDELILPRTDVIRGERFDPGGLLKAVITHVELKNNNPQIYISRTDSTFLEKLMEQEVPEIEDGVIAIKKIVRLPGERAKVAVESFDDRVDPVGACVGMKGSRIHGIVRELRNENIDIVPYTLNEKLFIQRSLTPAKVTSIELNPEKKVADVYLDQDQVSLAIGKGGTNIRLASKLTDYEINVYRADQVYEEVEDIDLDEFTDEIEDWVIDELKGIGCDTARNVLSLSTEELVRRTDLEEETIEGVREIFRREFEGE
ncbi:MAG TPA: transcription termination/antitermination protein NusA [Saprospiraceae bacterium]|nr:transcription termination/antitermination protein NusA [Saprospiraceae bacterium]